MIERGDDMTGIIGLLTAIAVLALVLAKQTPRNRVLLDDRPGYSKDRLWPSFAGSLAPMLMTVFPRDVWEMTAQKLSWSDTNMTPLDFLALKVTTGLLVPLLLGVFGVMAGVNMFVFVILALAGYILPEVWLDRRVRTRQAAIQKDLFEFELLLSTVLAAGMEVMNGFRVVGEQFTGELKKEIKRIEMDMSTGATKEEALLYASARIGLADFNKLANLIIQSANLGTPLADTLKVLVMQMKVERSTRITEEMERAKVTLLFPTVVFIFIPLFFMLGYPIMKSLGNVF